MFDVGQVQHARLVASFFRAEAGDESGIEQAVGLLSAASLKPRYSPMAELVFEAVGVASATWRTAASFMFMGGSRRLCL